MLALHGSPSSRLDFAPLHQAAARAGVRLIAPDRPGIGASSAATGHTILGWARGDAATLADLLELETFAVLGFSGGGPFALGCAVALPNRVTGIFGASMAGPIDHPGGRHGMSWDDRALTTLSLHTSSLARLWLRGMAVAARVSPAGAVKVQQAAMSAASSDVLNSLGSPNDVLAPFRESLRQGPAGAVQDFALLSRPFGFSLADVSQPVRLFHGNSDRVVPLEHARYLAANLPYAELTEIPDEGHLLLYSQADRLLAVLKT